MQHQEIHGPTPGDEEQGEDADEEENGGKSVSYILEHRCLIFQNLYKSFIQKEKVDQKRCLMTTSM